MSRSSPIPRPTCRPGRWSVRASRLVPLTVVLGDQALEEGTEISTRSLAQALQKRRSVTTSRPSPQVFAETYRRVAESGASGIVSLHLSAELSGTHDAAVLAAREAPVPVRVVDTGMVAMALGFCALAAAETAEAAARWTRPSRPRRNEPTARPPTSTSTPSTICAAVAGSVPPRPAGFRARRQAAAPAGGRPDRAARKSPYGVQGDRTPGGTHRRAGGQRRG